MTNEIITTPEAAKRLNLTHTNLLKILSRYPHLQPDKRVGLDYIWSDEDLESIEAHRARSRPGPKPKT